MALREDLLDLSAGEKTKWCSEVNTPKSSNRLGSKEQTSCQLLIIPVSFVTIAAGPPT